MRTSVVDYCASIGKSPLLVQGAGGNVSWKDGDTLWVKASGTWLADAAQKDIFVPVDLAHLRAALASGDFGISPKALQGAALRPSIETLLHALMPHPVVVHLHAIEALAHLVRRDCESDIASLIGGRMRWVDVAYMKPGAALAREIGRALERKPDANIVFMRNHGVVLGGRDVAEVDALLRAMIEALEIPPRPAAAAKPPKNAPALEGCPTYLPASDPAVHRLATDGVLYERLASDWALYPDHVVFLGPAAYRYGSIEDAQMRLPAEGAVPEVIFVRDAGVYIRPEFNAGKQAQLRCYYDVLSRQPEKTILNALTAEQIAELLDWDAEKYRMHIAK